MMKRVHCSTIILLSCAILIDRYQARLDGDDGDSLCLPQNDPNRVNRQSEVVAARSFWINAPFFHAVDGIPTPFRFGRGLLAVNETGSILPEYAALIAQQQSEYIQNSFNTDNNALTEEIKARFPLVNYSSFDELADIYNLIEDLIEVPTTSLDIRNDDAFAQDRLTIMGFNLRRRRRADGPLDFPAAEIVRELTGTTLQMLVKEKRLFENNLNFCSNYPKRRAGPIEFDPQEPQYAPGVHALFFIDDEGTFKPLAIKVFDTGLVYTPLDEEGGHWTFAKMALGVADGNWQPMYHFVVSHLIMEPVEVAMNRYMSPKHPVFALLSHHFSFGLFIKAAGLISLFSAGTVTDTSFGWRSEGLLEFAGDALADLDWSSEVDFGKKFRQKGLRDLPNYKFRDDFLAIRRRVRSFVRSYLKAYYTSQEDFDDDYELEAFLAAVIDPEDGAVGGFPRDVDSVKKLAKVISDMIMAVGPLHRAWNAEDRWHASALPMRSRSFWAPLPTSKEGTLDLLSFMPPREVTWAMVAQAATFYRPVPGTEFTLSGSYDNANLGFNRKAERAVVKLQNQLEELSVDIQKREAGSGRPYTELDPAQIPYFSWI